MIKKMIVMIHEINQANKTFRVGNGCLRGRTMKYTDDQLGVLMLAFNGFGSGTCVLISSYDDFETFNVEQLLSNP